MHDVQVFYKFVHDVLYKSRLVFYCRNMHQVLHAQRAAPAGPEVNLTYEPSELAERLGVGRSAIYKGLREGTIPSIRIGKRFIIPRTAINTWLKGAVLNQGANAG